MSFDGLKRIIPLTQQEEEQSNVRDRAWSSKADVIVMGSRGLGHIKGMLMGSVSHKVNHLAECTCITVK